MLFIIQTLYIPIRIYLLKVSVSKNYTCYALIFTVVKMSMPVLIIIFFFIQIWLHMLTIVMYNITLSGAWLILLMNINKK